MRTTSRKQASRAGSTIALVLSAIALTASLCMVQTNAVTALGVIQFGHGWYKAGGQTGADVIGGGIGDESIPDVALRPNGQPCAAFMSASGSGAADILVGCFNGSIWTGPDNGNGYSNISNSPFASENPDIAIAPDGTLYVAWLESTKAGPIPDREVRLVFFDGTNWSGFTGPYDVVSQGLSAGTSITLAINPIDGHPAVAWNSKYQESVLYREWNGLTWKGRTGSYDKINGTQDKTVNALELSLAMGSNQAPSVLWTNYDGGGYGEILFRRWDGSKWRGYVSTNSDNLSLTPLKSEHQARLALFNDGRPAVTWEDATVNEQVRYLEWSGAMWRGHGGATADTVQSGSNGASPTLAINPATNAPVISYLFFSGSANQMYVTQWNGGWVGLASTPQTQVDLKDASLNNAHYQQAALDATGHVHLVWYYTQQIPVASLNVAYTRWK